MRDAWKSVEIELKTLFEKKKNRRQWTRTSSTKLELGRAAVRSSCVSASFWSLLDSVVVRGWLARRSWSVASVNAFSLRRSPSISGLWGWERHRRVLTWKRELWRSAWVQLLALSAFLPFELRTIEICRWLSFVCIVGRSSFVSLFVAYCAFSHFNSAVLGIVTLIVGCCFRGFPCSFLVFFWKAYAAPVMTTVKARNA